MADPIKKAMLEKQMEMMKSVSTKKVRALRVTMLLRTNPLFDVACRSQALGSEESKQSMNAIQNFMNVSNQSDNTRRA